MYTYQEAIFRFVEIFNVKYISCKINEVCSQMLAFWKEIAFVLNLVF